MGIAPKDVYISDDFIKFLDLKNNYGFISQKTMDEINEELRTQDENNGMKVVRKLSVDALANKCYEGFDMLPGEMPDIKANGTNTIGENIADLGGTETDYQAYLNRLKDGFTEEQLKLQK